MPVGELYGWAICGKYLLRELSKKCDVRYIEGMFSEQVREDEDDVLATHKKVDDCVSFGKIIHTLTPGFTPSCESWGNKNIGYMFYEKDKISNNQKHNLEKFDVVVAGSEWNADVIRRNGIECTSIPQGVDQEIFNFKPPETREGFYLFSGGKWEPRKAQSIVIEAFKRFKQKHKDAHLIASWHNLFDRNAEEEIRKKLYGVSGVYHIGLQTHKNLAGFMAMTNLGLFPNTAEGGTNLVLMEYLSTGRPAIINVSTGQKDVFSDEYSYKVTGSRLLDETMDALEYAYQHRDKFAEMGKKAHKAMSYFSWERMAERFMSL